ncbi:hypothetical protein B7R78_0022045 [Ralstonia solanacearum]|uniref:hypothetical protein n=1 Tax=Ralstonia solanacearum TaxID=305 RepID=UPI001143C949|nr:hypothetical protein [Ralstonia solanacearum]MBT1539661.1 hypothetical protein [Ralstonia solanacearum]
MNIRFRNVAILYALVFFALALTWMLAPGLLLSSWGIELSSQAGLVGRRGAALYAGTGVMLLGARNAAPSPARSALLRGAVVACLVLAVLGVFEFATGHAKAGILVAVAIEIALAMAFLLVAQTQQSIQ